MTICDMTSRFGFAFLKFMTFACTFLSFLEWICNHDTAVGINRAFELHATWRNVLVGLPH